jgi:hypothetical protein
VSEDRSSPIHEIFEPVSAADRKLMLEPQRAKSSTDKMLLMRLKARVEYPDPMTSISNDEQR